MKLHVVYRSIGTENEKNRPPFYDKRLALGSLLRAAENSGVPIELVFLNDGPLPRERLELMRSAGEVMQAVCGSNRASVRRALTLPRERAWNVDDLVWFAEDDYLYTTHALAAVVEAARALGDADYFALYKGRRFAANATRLSPFIRQEVGDGQDTVLVGRSRWYRAVSTTSTFGCRVRTALADEWLLRHVPFGGGGFDHATCLTLQGYRPFGLHELGGTTLSSQEASAAKRVVRRLALTTIRLTLDAVALSRPTRARRTFVAAEPELATHMEIGQLAPDTDWAAEAASVADWLRDRELPSRSLPREHHVGVSEHG